MLAIHTYFVLIIATLATGLLVLYKKRFQYWKEINVPSAQAKIPFGALKNPIFEKESFGDLYERIYKEYKAKGCKHVGLFTYLKPVYVPIDLAIVKNILLYNFNHFVDRGFYYNEKEDPLSAHLFSLGGSKWRNLRAKVTPTFTTGKLKSMFPLITEHALQLNDAINQASLRGKAIDAKVMIENYNADIIGSVAFGLDCNSFKNSNSEYRKNATRSLRFTKFESIKFAMFFHNHDFGRFLKYCMTPKEVSEFFLKTISETVRYRETTNYRRSDYMQLLIDLKNNPDPAVSLSLDELAAEAYVFFVGGVETSSTTFTYLMYEVAMDEGIQEKLRVEVNSVLKEYDGQITYESLSKMNYMQQVIDETLRKHPSVTILNRRCTKPYKIPGTGIVLEKGTDVVIPVQGIHHDEEYYPKHQKFDPERFNKDNKAKLPNCCQLGFGDGPRICIGMRFALMALKVGLATLITNFKFSLGEGTPKVLKTNPYAFVLTSSENIFLNVGRVA